MIGPPTPAKTRPPSLPGVLARERLFELLDARRRSPVVWVAGPPGCGKTTLVASYLEARVPDALWYQLDAGDSDVATFFYHMSLAVQAAGRASGAALPLFTSEYHGGLAAFARRFFQSLQAALGGPFLLVLDNYQELAIQSAFHGALVDAAAEMPPDSCIVVISRADPPSSMVRLRANRQLETLGWNELRLTREESEGLVADWRPDLPATARRALHERAQGWAAGLVLLLAQAAEDGAVGDLPEGHGPHHLIFDYLAEELFRQFDDPTRALLLRTAFLPEMTAGAAAVLSRDPEAGMRLARMHRGHHLVSLRGGDTDPVYQYHPLLRDFLRSRAAAMLPVEELRELRRRSAEQIEDQGSLDEAVALLRDDRDHEALVALVRRHAPALLLQGRIETLEGWLEAWPAALLARDPWVCYWRAACRFYSAPRESRLLYEQAHERFAAAPSPDREALLLACAGVMDAIIYELEDLSLLDRWIETATGLLAGEPEPPRHGAGARISVSLFMAMVFRQPRHPDLRQWAERAYERLDAIEDVHARLGASLLVAINLNYTGQFARARAFLEELRRTCALAQVPPLALIVLKDVESMYSAFTGDHEACLKAAFDGLEVGRASGVRLWSYHLLSNGAAGALGSGDLDTAEELLGRMREHEDSARRLDLCIWHYYSAWLAMLRGEPSRAYQEQRTALGLAVECGCPYYEVVCRLALAQVLVALGDGRQAAAHLREVRRAARAINNRLLEFQCLLAYADIALEHGRERSGRRVLRYALGLGRERGFLHVLWWQPRVMARLCRRALEEGIEVDYVRRLVRERHLMPEAAPLRVAHWPWPFRVESLGEFRVWRDGERLGGQGKVQQKPLELLKTLVAFGAEGVPEAAVAESMWPRIDGDYAHRSLTTTLHRLRKLLGEDRAVVLRHGRLTLEPRRVWLDVRALEALFEEIESAVRPGAGVDDARLEALGEELFRLYRGPFMASEGEHPRYVAPRERMRNRFLRHLGALARFFEENGAVERAADLYHRALDADPLSESCYRRLMLCYRSLGRQAEAVEIYDRCRRILRAELGVDPSPETAAIHRSLLKEL